LDTQVEYRGLTISQAGQTYANGRSITYRDVTFTGYACGIPTVNMLWQVINTNMSTCNMEVDKIIDTLVFSGVTIHQVIFQSASVNTLQMDNTTVTSLINATPITSIISNSNIASFNHGAIAYTVSKQITCTSCVLSSIGSGGFVEHNVNTSYTMTNDTLVISNQHGPVTWAIPGANLIWTGQYQNEGSFTVTDVSQDATYAYVQTSLSGTFPFLPLSTNGMVLGVRTHPAPNFTCTQCTGSADALDLSQAPAGAPLYSYTKRTYTGSLVGDAPPVMMWGRLIGFNVSVTKPYTGSTSPVLLNPTGWFHYFTVRLSDGSVFDYVPSVNLALAGVRNVTPSSVVGAQLGDTNLSVPEAIWFTGPLSAHMDSDISLQSPALWPSVTIEVITDQRIPQNRGRRAR
jgi:hypothetical protein